MTYQHKTIKFFKLQKYEKIAMCVSHSVMSDSATPWTVACQTPLSKEVSRQE